MTRTGETGAAPTVQDTQSAADADAQRESALGRELGDLYLTQQAVLLYNDLKQSNRMTFDLANKVEARAASLREDIMGTEFGRKADETLAATTKSVVGCFALPPNSEDGPQHSIVSRVIIKLFQLCFRFFLPTMLFRWSVDIALVSTEFALALTKDFVRSGSNTAPPAREPAKGFEASGDAAEPQAARTDKDTAASATKQEPKNSRNGVFSTWWEVVMYFITLNYYSAKLFAVFFVIPYLNYQWYFLHTISWLMHSLAGMNHKDTGTNQDKENNPPGPALPRDRRLRRRQWLTDTVVNRVACQLLDIPVAGLFLEMMGVKRQLNFFRRLQKAIQGDQFVVGVRDNGATKSLLNAMGNLSRFVEGDMAAYLYLDCTYNEDDDSDYVPSESSEDSLEYSDDLDATTGKDGNDQSRHA